MSDIIWGVVSVMVVVAYVVVTVKHIREERRMCRAYEQLAETLGRLPDEGIDSVVTVRRVTVRSVTR